MTINRSFLHQEYYPLHKFLPRLGDELFFAKQLASLRRLGKIRTLQ